MPEDYFNKKIEVVIDRTMGSKHPKFGWDYPINYGFIPNTVQGDGEEIDAYCIGPKKPVERFTGTCIAYIERADDVGDAKLVVVDSENKNLSNKEILELVEFQEQYFSPVIIRP